MKHTPTRKYTPMSWGSLALAVGLGILLLAVIISAGSRVTASPTSRATTTPLTKVAPPPRSTDPWVIAHTRGMTFLTEVPTTIPANGVALLGGEIILRQLTSDQHAQVTLSSSSAIAVAKPQGPPGSQISPPLLASFTVVGTLPRPGEKEKVAHPIQDVPVWLVTFMSPFPLYGHNKPTNPNKSSSQTTSPPVYFHRNIAIDARSGAFVLGFGTP